MNNKNFITKLKRKSTRIINFRCIYHKKFYKNNYSGPSLYFHLKSIREKDFDRKIEYIYATLVSWGMHRMGKGGAKMVDFRKFRKSIKNRKIINRLEILRNCRIEKQFDNWKELEYVFRNIKIMYSKKPKDEECILVGNSKVLAHLLPNLVPPIDREYTLQYQKGKKRSVPPKIDNQWKLFKDLMENLFIPVAKDKKILSTAIEWKKNKEYMSDTSIPKIIDNLIMGSLK